MWIDLVTVLVLAFAAWTGWRRGTLPVALSLLGLGGGYLAGVAAFRPVGAALTRVWGVPPMLAAPLGGAIAFFVVSAALRIVAWKVNRRLGARRLEGWTPSRPDRAGGAVLAAIWAMALVVAVAWAMMALRSFTNRGPAVAESLTGRASAWTTRRVAYAATRRLAGDPLVADMMSFMAADPQRGAAALRTLMGDARVRGLLSDPALRQALARGDARALQGSGAVSALAGDANLRRAAGDAGLVSGDPGAEAIAHDLASRAGPLARAVEATRADPETQRLLNDPAVRRRLTAGNVDALIADPGFNQLVSRLLGQLRQGAAVAP